MPEPDPRTPSVVELGRLASDAGLRRIHVLAWRDLYDPEAGGSEVHAAEVARIWAEAGLEVTMRTSAAQGQPHDSLRDGYRVIRRRGRYTVFPAAATAEALGRHGPTDGLVEIWNGVPFLTPLWARVPRVVFLHHLHRDMWKLVMRDDLARAGEVFERRIAPRFYRRTPVVTLSSSSRSELIDEMGFRPSQVRIVPPGIDARFRPSDAPKHPTPLVVAVGRLTQPKRFDVLIRAVAEVRADVPDVELVIVGSGYEQDRLANVIAELDASSWVTLTGRASDAELVEWYQRAWVVAAASIAEGWGMTLTEAAACGTPAVATRIAGHLDSVAEGESGLLAGDDRAIVTNLRAVLTDPELRTRLSEGALKHAAAFTWQATAAGTLEVLVDEARRRRANR